MSTNEYTIRGLPQSKEFEFRVVPFNAAGAGEPSEPTGYVKIQKPKGKYIKIKVHMNMLYIYNI